MIEIRETLTFSRWLESLRDKQARSRIQARILRLKAENPGDVKPVGEGILEMRIDHGSGYRVYFARQGSQVIILLAGGVKNTQTKDIRIALEMARNL